MSEHHTSIGFWLYIIVSSTLLIDYVLFLGVNKAIAEFAFRQMLQLILHLEEKQVDLPWKDYY